MKMTHQEYRDYVKKKSPNSPVVRNCLKAFFFGGLICTAGQGLLEGCTALGLDSREAGTAVSLTLIFLGALFTGLNLYGKVARFAGAGTLVPITGFANSIVSPALEFKSEGFILGMSAKMFTIAGPVLVFGITASVVYGVILVLLQSF